MSSYSLKKSRLDRVSVEPCQVRKEFVTLAQDLEAHLGRERAIEICRQNEWQSVLDILTAEPSKA